MWFLHTVAEVSLSVPAVNRNSETVLGWSSDLQAMCWRHLYCVTSLWSSDRNRVSGRVVVISQSSDLTSCCPNQSVNVSLPSFLSLSCSCRPAPPGVIAAPGCHGDGAIIEMAVKLCFLLLLLAHILLLYSALQI